MRWSDSRSPIQSGQLTPRGPPVPPSHPYWHLINDNLTRTCLYCQKGILFEREQKRLKQIKVVIKLFHREVVPLSPFPTLLLERLDLPHQLPQWHWNFSWDFQITILSWLPLIKTNLTLSHSSKDFVFVKKYIPRPIRCFDFQYLFLLVWTWCSLWFTEP